MGMTDSKIMSQTTFQVSRAIGSPVFVKGKRDLSGISIESFEGVGYFAPAPQKIIDQLPEGDRKKNPKLLYSKSQLKSRDAISVSGVEGSHNYSVINLKNYLDQPEFKLAHNSVIVVDDEQRDRDNV